MKSYQNIDWMLLKKFRLSQTNPDTGRPYNQQDIAKAIGKKQSYVSRLEKGDYRYPDNSVVEALATFFGLKPKHFVGYLEKRDTETNYIKDAKITYSSEPLPIPKYTQPYNARGMAYKDAILFENGDLVDRHPVLKNVTDAYAVVMPSHDMEPRYRQGDTLYVNPEISPEDGDDVVIHLKFNHHDVCIIREVISTKVDCPDGLNENTQYGVLSLASKQAHEEEAWLAKREKEPTVDDHFFGGSMFDFHPSLSDNAEWFEEQNPDDELTFKKDEKGQPLLNAEDNSSMTVAEFNRLAESMGAKRCVKAVAIHTIVGTQRHRLISAKAHLKATSVMTAKPEVGQATVVTENN